ncbi:MAG: hypothetical protein HKN45_09865 [Flavobacteriales bacterium]|nr:hypothetical protein [Flavobacteriales bacterium]
MADILDEHLTRREKQEELCKKLRFYTLLFTGLMAIVYLSFRLLHWAGGDVCLLIGLVTITLQSLACFLTMKEKTVAAGIRALITLLATIYILSIFYM